MDTSRTSDMSMAMIIKRGDQQLVRFMAMKKKKFPDSEKQHIRFLEPGGHPEYGLSHVELQGYQQRR